MIAGTIAENIPSVNSAMPPDLPAAQKSVTEPHQDRSEHIPHKCLAFSWHDDRFGHTHR